MCLFPIKNTHIDGPAYKKGLTEFECGQCPECLKRRASGWAVRASYELLDGKAACMLCLTYDQYVRDSHGHIVGERVASDMQVSKRDVQLFIKRVRKHFTGIPVKYLAAAEYGSRTHRPHYHVILFGVTFHDAIPYKRSKRGNVIYRSPLLEKLWKNGICTVDSLNVNSAAVRYCTKYCAKIRAENTFMLFSHGIGEKALLEKFDGIGYNVEGRLYPIPRSVWNKKIAEWYVGVLPEFTYKYRSIRDYGFDVALENAEQRRAFRKLRDADEVYQRYLEYWKCVSALASVGRPGVLERINALPEDKFHFYKGEARLALSFRSQGVPVPAPRSLHKATFIRWYENRYNRLGIHVPFPSCLGTANDTKTWQKGVNEIAMNWLVRKKYHKPLISYVRGYGNNPFDNPPFFPLAMDLKEIYGNLPKTVDSVSQR